MGRGKAEEDRNEVASAGHLLGQLVGDWWETCVVFPMLEQIAKDLELFPDNRVVTRSWRGSKLEWKDADGNIVDYDFVLELEGSSGKCGIPVAFFESFWRRGARHSKDKARDDTNKLLPMRDTYPTARFLAIAACGEFTEPAREYVRSRGVELFYVPKKTIIEAFAKEGLVIDYDDRLAEPEKLKLAHALQRSFEGGTVQQSLCRHLHAAIGHTTFKSFENRVIGSLTATPQEIRIISIRLSEPRIFPTLAEAEAFFEKPAFEFSEGEEQFTYEVSYSDGTEFSRTLDSMDAVKDLHHQLAKLVAHMERVTVNKEPKSS